MKHELFLYKNIKQELAFQSPIMHINILLSPKQKLNDGQHLGSRSDTDFEWVEKKNEVAILDTSLGIWLILSRESLKKLGNPNSDALFAYHDALCTYVCVCT